MSIFQILNYARLTNQEEATIRFMHLTQYTDLQNIPEFLRSIPGLTWCSRFFNYDIKMLQNLAPGSPAVQHPPFNNLPPAHLLIGYTYLFNVNNNYHFSSRTYTRLKYDSHISQIRRPRNFWSTLSDCSYILDTSNLALGNLEENILSIQRDIVMNRIVADLQAREDLDLAGTGISLQPEAIENIRLQEVLNNMHTKCIASYLNGPSFALPLQYHYETEKDKTTYKYINQLLKVITNFIYDWYFKSTKEYLPFQDNWIQQLCQKYQDWLPMNENYMTSFLLAQKAYNNSFQNWQTELRGGARLRSGTRTDLPIRLRPRQNGRAVTQSIRRNRGQIVENFINSLPLVRRIRRPIPRSSPEEDEDAGEGPSGLQDTEQTLGEEILRTLQTVLNELREELTETAREHEIFNFSQQFYNLYEEALRANRITPDFVRRFFFYFFIMEHIASTLYYYHTLLNLNVPFRQYVHFNYIQVIITGTNVIGQVNLRRIWHSNNISPFLRIYRQILHDLLVITNRTEIVTPHDEQDLLAALEHRPESGDPNDLIQQGRLNEEEVKSIKINFKLNPIGLVTTTTNRTIIANVSSVRTQEMRRLRTPQ